MIRPLHGCVACVLTLGVARSADAQRDRARDSTAISDTARLSPVLVLGSILDGAGPAVGTSSTARTTRIAGVALARWRPRTLAHAMQGETAIGSYDDLGSPYKLTLQSRGFTASPVVGVPQGLSVFLDGIPVNEPDAAQVNFDLLPLAQVERVELLSGTAALLGPNSLGGAVNLVTHRGGAPSSELAFSAGSFGRYELEASRGGTARGWRYHTGASLERDGGWRQVTGARLGNVLLNLARDGNERGVAVQLQAARSRAETAGSLPLSVYAIRPDSNLSAQDFEDLDQLHVAVSAYASAGAGRASAQVYGRLHGAERFNVNQVDDPDVRSFSRNRTAGATADWRVAGRALGGAASLRIGASGASSDVGIRIRADLAKFGRADSLTTHVTSAIARGALFAGADARWGALSVSAGARGDAVRIPFRNRLRPARDTTNLFLHVSPRGGVSVDVARGTTLHASIGRSFRAPAIIELACADPEEPCPLPFALGDDPPLAPVVATTGEVGATWRASTSELSMSAYRTEVKDDIFLHPYSDDDEPTGSTIDGYFANVPRTRREGVELSTRTVVGGALSLRASYAYTRASFRSAAEIFSIREEEEGENEVEPGDRLPLVPAHALRASGELALPRGMMLGVQVRHDGARWLRGDEANETAPLSAFTVADAMLGVGAGSWRIEAVVENVLGRRYATFGTFNINQGADDRLERFLTPGMPRAVRLTVRWLSE